ncbi:hypothetical protein EON77_00550, partial [bacterium]
MSRRRRFRKFAAPWRGLVSGGLTLLFGLSLVFAGILLSFNSPFETLVGKAQRLGYRLVGTFATGSEADLAVYWIGAAVLLIGVYL